MKKLLIITVSFVIYYHCEAQFKMTSTGNIGIGYVPGIPHVTGDLSKLELGAGHWLRFNAPSGYPKAGIVFTEVTYYGDNDPADARYGGRIYYDEEKDGIILETKQNYVSNIGIFVNRTYGKVGIGMTNPSYKLDVEGSIRASGTVTWSDSRLKKEVKKLPEDKNLITKFNNLEAISYKADLLRYQSIVNDNNSLHDTLSQEYKDKIKNRMERTQYGYDAEQLQQYFPELVSEDDEGYLGIDYISMIPLIIQAYKYQKNEIDKMADEINQLKLENGILKSSSLLQQVNKPTLNILYQNSPNPFTENTVIKYLLSEDYSTAGIYIYNLNGKQLKVYKLYNIGSGNITISGNEFEAGMYFYSLIIDDKMVDTKTMILTGN